MGDIPNWGKYGGNFCLVEVVRISIDVYWTAGVGVRPKSDGYGYEVREIRISYLFSGRDK